MNTLKRKKEEEEEEEEKKKTICAFLSKMSMEPKKMVFKFSRPRGF